MRLRSIVSMVAVVLMAFTVVGCSGQEASKEDSSWGMNFGPSWAQNPPQSEDKLYGIANARSRTLNTAIQRANLRATQQIAQQIGQSIQAWQEDYQQEMGQAAEAEVLQSFESLTERVVDEQLQGVQEEKRAVQQQDNGVYNAWVMVSANMDSVTQQFSEMQRLETEFSRSKAREQLQQRIDPQDKVAQPEGGN